VQPVCVADCERHAEDLLEPRCGREVRSEVRSGLAKVLGSDAVTDAIRKELKRTTGQKVEAADIKKLLADTVVRPECLS
jgi:hypothetical protein